MNKTQLIDAIAEQAGLSKVDAKKALDAFVAIVSGSLKNNDNVSLVGFGSFSVVGRQGRNGVNPRTGQKIQIPARRAVKFSPGIELSKRL
ncbi:MAG: HU family DNA-binding protein [Odoribacteraceae bacterium]|jgi:DNA-binding protein HU-beta|nr:HU family DNA-binding protein [Odoribacteraceae bacterium]